MRSLAAAILLVSFALPLHAQTPDDGVMMERQALFAGNIYTRETWDRYWEGVLKRTNGNIGTITTQINTWYADYGLADRLNVIAAVPYVWTRASQGVLHGSTGFQDLTLAAKYSAFERQSATFGSLRAIAVVSAAIPLTDYNVDLQPLSIGNGSTRVSWRGTLHLHTRQGWFITGSGAYTWRSQVKLDRPYFYTDGEFVMSDQVDMPNALDGTVRAGYMRGGLMTAILLSQRWTLGGGDIHRQDAPFISNRVDASAVAGTLMYPVPKLSDLAFTLAYSYIYNGRNIGQAGTLTTGLFYQLGQTR